MANITAFPVDKIRRVQDGIPSRKGEIGLYRNGVYGEVDITHYVVCSSCGTPVRADSTLCPNCKKATLNTAGVISTYSLMSYMDTLRLALKHSGVKAVGDFDMALAA